MRQSPWLCLVLAAALRGAAQDPVYPCRSGPGTLLTNEDAFRPFAEAVRADVIRLLGEPDAGRNLGRLKLLLAIRVHLALHYGDDAAALDAARRIQQLQADPEDRAFAGVTAEAIVAAERATGQRPGGSAFAAAFAREFGLRLAALPATAAMGANLRSQREKNAAYTPDSIRRDLLARLGGSRAHRGAYTLEEADQIIRAHHRLADLWPIEPGLLSALDAAIAARP